MCWHRNVLVYDESLSSLILENHSVAPRPHFAFSVAEDGVFLNGGGSPAQIAVVMEFDIVVHRKLAALIVFQDRGYALLILLPTVVFEGCDIEKSVRACGIVLFHVGGVQRRPAVPNLLHVGFVGRGAVRRRLVGGFFWRSKARKAECEETNEQGQDAFRHGIPPSTATNCRIPTAKAQKANAIGLTLFHKPR